MDPLTMFLLAQGVSASGNTISGFMGANASRDAARIQSRSADKAMSTMKDFYGQAMSAQQPFLDAGGEGLSGLMNMINSGGLQNEVPNFQRKDYNFEKEPGYDFRLSEGLKGVERGAAARGGVLGGGTLKDLTEYSQGFASNEYSKGYNRDAREQVFDYGLLGDSYNRNVQQTGIEYGGLIDLTGIGKQAAGNVSNLSTGLGSSLSSLLTQQGNVNAAGTMSQSNSYGNMINSVLGGGSQMAMLYGMGAFGGGGDNYIPGSAGMGGTLPDPMANQGLPWT